MNLIKQNWIGLLGLILLCSGIPMHAGVIQNIFNIIGIAALILYARLKKNEFFFYLESVVLLGTVLKIINVSFAVLVSVLIIASILSLVKVFQNKAYRTWDASFGLIGLMGLVYGYSTLSNYGYAVGGVASAIYSFIGYKKGLQSALIFVLLNIIYSALAIYMIVNA